MIRPSEDPDVIRLYWRNEKLERVLTNYAQLLIKYVVNNSLEYSPILTFNDKKERENVIKKLMY